MESSVAAATIFHVGAPGSSWPETRAAPPEVKRIFRQPSGWFGSEYLAA